MERKIFAFDVDGTLLDHKYNEIPASAIDTIKELKDKGHIVGVATGRNESQFLKVLKKEDFDFVILCNGGYLEMNGKKVYDIQFKQSQKNELCDLFDAYDYKYSVTTHHELFSPTPDHENVQRVIDSFKVITPQKKRDLRVLPTYQFCLYEADIPKKIEDKLREEYQVHSLGEFGYDIVVHGINKSIMLEKVAELLQMSMNDTIAFGDGDNDCKFVEKAGVGVAMGNAVESVKRRADIITTESYNDGIRNAVKELGYL